MQALMGRMIARPIVYYVIKLGFAVAFSETGERCKTCLQREQRLGKAHQVIDEKEWIMDTEFVSWWSTL